MPSLTAWLSDPKPDRGVYLANSAGGWDFTGYPELAATAGRVAAALVASGVRPGDPVCVLMPTGYPVLCAIYGVWAAGGTICPVVPPAFQPEDEYIGHVAAILEQAQPVLTITTTEFEPLVAQAMQRAGRPGTPWVFREGQTGIAPQPTGEIALLQFTSGSTGTPRGVRVSWDNLEANLAVIQRWSGWRDGDGLASWLPLHHDMGLIGCLFVPVAKQGNLWLMRPDQFIRDPLRWLRCFAPGKATHAAAPSFAFAYAVRRVPVASLEGLDLSRWRTVCVGAETTDVAALAAFARFAAPTGFSRHTFLPSYGLAENTLAVTSPAREHVARIVRPEWTKLRFGESVQLAQSARLGDVPVAPGSGWLIAHGRPPDGDGIAVRIVDDDGNPLPDGHLGEIAVTGTSMARGYHGGRAGGSSRFIDGELRTGDAGFFDGGELFVLGRMGDSLKLRGRNVYVEDLDAKVAAAAGLSKGSVVVVSSTDRGRAGVAVFAEARPGPWNDAVVRALREELGPEPIITVVSGQRGLISRTSSGKPRRRLMWQQLQAGELATSSVQAHDR